MPNLMTAVKVDARALAWMAESADGRRDKDLVVIKNQDGKLELVDKTAANEGSAILEVRTSSRKRQEAVERTLTIPADCDALFLTESAVEKFLFPYYAAQRLLSAAELKALKEKFYSRSDVVAMLHKPPSRPAMLHANGEIEDFPVGAGLAFEIKEPAPPKNEELW